MNDLLPERRRKTPEINIVPLIDVLTTLIFFFMTMMQFRQAQTLNITLPEIKSAGKNMLQQSINISIDKDGTYYYNNQIVTGDEIKEILSKIGKASDKPPLVIRADEETPLKSVTYMMDTCRLTGFDDFRLQSRGSD